MSPGIDLDLMRAAIADAEKLNRATPTHVWFGNSIHFIVEDRHDSRVYNRNVLWSKRQHQRRNRRNGRLVERDPHRKDNRWQWGKLKPFCSPTRALWMNGRGETVSDPLLVRKESNGLP